MPVVEAIRGIIGIENVIDVTDNTDILPQTLWRARAAFSAFHNRNFVFHRQFRNLTVAPQLQFRNRNFFCIPQLYQTKFSFMPVRTFSSLIFFIEIITYAYIFFRYKN
jgi:hypothetical protein